VAAARVLWQRLPTFLLVRRMFRKPVSALVTVVAIIALTGCEASKSANPLSATIAGPIPGVNITAPTPMQPSSGLRVAVDQQPVQLVVQNASTSGVRPLSYSFDVATDINFTNKVFSRTGISPGDGKTGLKLPNPLPTGQTYYWRAQALDGANTGPYSAVTSFNIYTPIVIQAPVPLAPINKVMTANPHPHFSWTNAPRTGPAGAISYAVEISADNFATKAAAWTVAEQANQTGLDAPQDLAFSTQYFWHVRANDPTTIGPWSATQTFLTPAAPLPVPTPNPVPTPTPPAPGDGINLNLAIIHNSPSDVASWPATATLTRLALMPTGAHVEFTKQNDWPGVTPPGWSGPLQYTLWIVLNINGQWHASGCIEYWRGLYENGGAVTGYAQNWYYDPGRWGPMAGHQPAVGEQVGFLVTAGDARNNGPTILKERSNVVVVPFPSASGASFTFSAASLQFVNRR
jgi:hypothetical protein